MGKRIMKLGDTKIHLLFRRNDNRPGSQNQLSPNATGAVRQSHPISLTFDNRLDNYKIHKCLFHMIKHQPENRSVGGSIPPLGTSKINTLCTS